MNVCQFLLASAAAVWPACRTAVLVVPMVALLGGVSAAAPRLKVIGNVAVGVILGAMIIGVGIVLRPALAPLALNLDATAADAVAYRILLHGVQVLVGIVLAVVSVGLSLWLFTRLTGSIDEWAEVGRGNVAIAAVLAGVIIATALITSTAMDAVLVLIVR